MAVGLIQQGVQYVEIAPETSWRHNSERDLVENDYARLYFEAAAAFDLDVVAHGVALSPSSRGDDERVAQWVARVAADRPEHLWYTDHHGLTVAGETMALPMPALPTQDQVGVTVQKLDAMRSANASVGLETTASYAHWGHAFLEAELQAQIAEQAQSHLLLDLHNVWTMAINGGFSAVEWLAHLDLSTVIEIHLSGGSPANPGWGGGMRPMWLDGHDDRVPEPVWALFEKVLPHCPNLRGVTLERMEGTMDAEHVPEVRAELDRIGFLCADVQMLGAPERKRRPLLPSLDDGLALQWQHSLGPAMRQLQPVQALMDGARSLPEAHRAAIASADKDGIRLSAMLIAKLRLERILNGVPGAEQALDTDPAGFTAEFSAYHREVPSTAVFPWDEARSFKAWSQTR